MRYTHWWACHPNEGGYARAWPAILGDTTRILTRAAGLGITICGPGGHGWPIIDRTGIALGGDAASCLDKQPLRLPPPHRQPHASANAIPPAATGSVNTGRHPYDTVVTAVLLRCHMLLGNNFAIRSDGGYDIEWAFGARHGHTGARTLVAGLFGAAPTTSPLSWPPHPTAGHL